MQDARTALARCMTMFQLQSSLTVLRKLVHRIPPGQSRRRPALCTSLVRREPVRCYGVLFPPGSVTCWIQASRLEKPARSACAARAAASRRRTKS